MITYRPSYTENNADKITKNNTGGGEYLQVDTALSNRYNNTYTTQRGGINYRFNKLKTNLTVGVDMQEAVRSQTYYQLPYSTTKSVEVKI